MGGKNKGWKRVNLKGVPLLVSATALSYFQDVFFFLTQRLVGDVNLCFSEFWQSWFWRSLLVFLMLFWGNESSELLTLPFCWHHPFSFFSSSYASKNPKDASPLLLTSFFLVMFTFQGNYFAYASSRFPVVGDLIYTKFFTFSGGSFQHTLTLLNSVFHANFLGPHPFFAKTVVKEWERMPVKIKVYFSADDFLQCSLCSSQSENVICLLLCLFSVMFWRIYRGIQI